MNQEPVIDGISRRLAMIRAEIAAALRRVDDQERRVTLIAVTKNVAPEVIRAAHEAGITDCGENRVQEGNIKLDALGGLPIRWHFIGRLQRNKVRAVVGRYTLVHSLDRLPLAQEIDRRAQQAGIRQDCLVQVNVSGDPNKAGVDPQELVTFLRSLSGMDGLRIRGLMTIAPLVTDPEAVRPVFRRLRLLAIKVQELGLPGVEMEHLSMGMTGDYIVAVEEGATMVRIGRGLFGPRPA